MNKKKVLIIAASVLMLGAVSIKPAMAYFTDTHSATGTVKFGKYEITPYEEVDGMTKKISIKNTGDYPVYTRVKVLAGSTHGLTFDKENSTDWYDKDGYYYYDKVLDVDSETSKLLVTIDPNDENKEEFNVIVVEEACRADKDGNPVWNEDSVNKEVYDAVKSDTTPNDNSQSPDADQTSDDTNDNTENEGGAN